MIPHAHSVMYQVRHVQVVSAGICYTKVIVIRRVAVRVDILYLLITLVLCVSFHVQLVLDCQQIVRVA